MVATANAIDALPPEFLRKGRFDEIFFVDLPDEAARAEILPLHIERRKRRPADFDLPGLARAADGFSGAELEQAIVAGLYTAFAAGAELTNEIVLAEIQIAVPLSVTMAEKVAALRNWARGRAVPAG
ncbi:MAG: SpoVK/Ycf46/Vps4 family AAA+-type ATPase [Chlamydiales bacterium]